VNINTFKFIISLKLHYFSYFSKTHLKSTIFFNIQKSHKWPKHLISDKQFLKRPNGNSTSCGVTTKEKAIIQTFLALKLRLFVDKKLRQK